MFVVWITKFVGHKQILHDDVRRDISNNRLSGGVPDNGSFTLFTHIRLVDKTWVTLNPISYNYSYIWIFSPLFPENNWLRQLFLMQFCQQIEFTWASGRPCPGSLPFVPPLQFLPPGCLRTRFWVCHDSELNAFKFLISALCVELSDWLVCEFISLLMPIINELALLTANRTCPMNYVNCSIRLNLEFGLIFFGWLYQTCFLLLVG